MATAHPTLTQLAQETAAHIGFTLRRWWREKTEPAVLRVEVERRIVGAPPAIAVLTVAIPSASSSRHVRPASTASSATRSRLPTPPRKRTPGTRRTKRPRKS